MYNGFPGVLCPGKTTGYSLCVVNTSLIDYVAMTPDVL
jgi:hypothetical protein